MTYARFLEEAYRAIWAQAPPVGNFAAATEWLRSIGEVLLHLPPELQREWADQYATLLVIKYGHIRPDIALVCVRYGLNEAEAHWPTRVEVGR